MLIPPRELAATRHPELNVEGAKGERRMNADLLLTINGWSGNPALDTVMKFAAGVLIFVSFAVLALLCALHLVARRLDRVVLVGTSLVLALGLGRGAAELFPNERPFTTHPEVHQLVGHEAGQSFPSDHSLAAFAIALAVAAFLSVRWGLALLAVASIVGFARIYVGVHYPADILGAALIAAVAVGAVVTLARTAVVARVLAARVPLNVRAADPSLPA